VADGWPVLDDAAFHGVAGEVVRALAPETEADPVGLLLSYLSAFGCAVGGGPHVRVGGDRHDTRLFVALVGETARARKGSSWSMVRPVLEAADPGFASRQLSGFGSGESVVDAVRDADPDRDDDQGVCDKRLLVHEPELSRLLRVASRDGSTLSPILRDAWDGVRLQARSRSRTSVGSRPLVVVLAHVVREELRRYLTDADVAGGFANRFAFALVRRSQRLPSGGNLDDALVADLAARTRDTLDGARRLGQLHRSPEAEAVWHEMYEELTGDVFGMYGAIVARAEAQCLRLTVAYAALDGSCTIEVPHLEAAWAVWRYCDQSARILFGNEATGDPVADRLLEALRAVAPAGLDFTDQRDAFGRNLTGSQLDEARERLHLLGLADTVEDRDTGGRPRHVTFAVTDDGNDRNVESGLPSFTSFRSYCTTSRPAWA
jgi:hypothetical protein